MFRWWWVLALAVLVSSLTLSDELVSSLMLNRGMVALSGCLSDRYLSEPAGWSLLDVPERDAMHCTGSRATLQWAGGSGSDLCSARRNLALSYLIEGDTFPAVAELQEARQDCPDDPLVILYLGIGYWRTGRTAEAIRVWQSLPDSREYFLQCGYAYRRLGNLRLAAQSFSISGTIDPTFALAHYWQALALVEMGRPEEAIPVLKQAVAADAGYADAYWLLGRKAELLGQTDTARWAYERLGGLPDAETFMKTLAVGRLKYTMQNWTAALAAFNTVQTMQSAPAEYRALAHQYAAETYAKMGNTKAAKEEWHRVAESNPSGAFYAYMRLGDIVAGEGKDLLALNYYRQAGVLQPGKGTPHGRAANVWLRLGRPDRAAEEARAAVELEPAVADYYMLLGEALERQGRWCEAQGVYVRLFSRDSSNLQARQKLSELAECQE